MTATATVRRPQGFELPTTNGSLREAIVREAESWLGTPFHHRARVKGAGVDCAQLLVGVYEAVGLVRNVDLGSYPVDWMRHHEDRRYLDGIARVALEVTVPCPGDIALFRVGRSVSHAGIVTEWPEIIHAHGVSQVERQIVTQHPRLLRGFAGWWSIVEAARVRPAGRR